MDGKFIAWDDANVHMLTHSLHYGAGAFEGVRCYKTAKGPAIFRLSEHITRWIYSSTAIALEMPYSQAELERATVETVAVNNVQSCYIRPISWYGYGKMGLSPKGAPVRVAIAAWPWGKYLDVASATVKISKYMRIHPQSSVTDAKITGHYVNSIMASIEAHGAGYTEALFLDYAGNVAEGPGENIFIVEDEKIVTPPLGTILPGITRLSVMELARDLEYEVAEEVITPERLKAADEAFFTGTAAEVQPISKVDNTMLKNEVGPVTHRLVEAFARAVQGEDEKYAKWFTYV